ncbi:MULTISPECIES: MarR family winged helix-turn-helix transcriptional regulator [unclassified Micromonospora]|uniref:MarR family winged helix-turn-helix transcriptional regulator n=1 Tax=unclassified Micromonospora TaxID=2617518 RepID=UPI00363DA1AE
MEPTRWLTDGEQEIWQRILAVLTLLPAELDGQLQRDADLTHFGYGVLAMLSEAPGRSRRMSELAALVNGSQSRLSHLVGRLERRGWVRRERADDDGRGSVAVLTDAGYAHLAASAPGHVAVVRSLVFDALTPAQVAQLGEITAALLTRLAPLGGCPAAPARGGRTPDAQ